MFILSAFQSKKNGNFSFGQIDLLNRLLPDERPPQRKSSDNYLDRGEFFLSTPFNSNLTQNEDGVFSLSATHASCIVSATVHLPLSARLQAASRVTQMGTLGDKKTPLKPLGGAAFPKPMS
jgi:hypothetical protein